MLHVDTAFAISLIYAAIVCGFIANVMVTAKNKNTVDLAFTLREIFLVAMFLTTATLILFNVPNFLQYTLSVSIGLDVVTTILFIVVFRAHLKWRKDNRALLAAMHNDEIFPGPARNES